LEILSLLNQEKSESENKNKNLKTWSTLLEKKKILMKNYKIIYNVTNKLLKRRNNISKLNLIRKNILKMILSLEKVTIIKKSKKNTKQSIQIN